MHSDRQQGRAPRGLRGAATNDHQGSWHVEGDFDLIDHAVRYLPILRLLRTASGGTDAVLEIGSGAYGLGEYYPNQFVGCDVKFDEKPRPPMRPVVASASKLPFPDACFDAVIASDVLEHVHPDARPDVLREAVRVARKIVVVGFPCGPRAYTLDQRLFARYQHFGRPVPPWLEEHMLHLFPDERVFEGLDPRWRVQAFGNDNLYFHEWLLRRMMNNLWMRFFRLVEKLPRRLLEHVLRLADHGACYRRIFAATRTSGSQCGSHNF
jgi:SAM-dependent methyltransferase